MSCFRFAMYLIPHLIILDPGKVELDALLETVDLSSYGLERVKLNAGIGLDDSETQVDPQNANPRGSHGGDIEKDELDLIIKSFNEKWFQGWDATPEDQRVKFVNLARKIKEHADYLSKYENNTDVQNRKIAFNRIFEDVMAQQRKIELDLYRLISTDNSSKLALIDTMERMVQPRINL